MEKKVLLIAEDEELDRNIIRKFLGEEYFIIEAENGVETMEIIESTYIDALILDIIMPEIDGFEVLKKIKTQKRLDHIGILVATSSKEKTERTALELCADDVVSKPYDVVVIKKRLENILAKKELHQREDELRLGYNKALIDLKKNQAWLQAAMDSAGIQYFEYFPDEHKAIGYQDNKKYGIPHILENYPECLFEMKLAHPDDTKSFRHFFERVNAGDSPAYWEGRFSVGAKYGWFKVIMTKVTDDDCKHRVISCTMTDITLQKESLFSYRNHLASILRSNPEAVASFQMNVTQNICYDGFSIYENILRLKDSGTVDGFLKDAQYLIPDEKERQQVFVTFNRQAILNAFAKGIKRISLEHRFILEKNHTEWITTLADLMSNPITGDVEGVLYTLNTNVHRIERVVLQNFLQKTYDVISVIDMNTDEYFLFERKIKTHGKHFFGFRQAHDSVYLRYMDSDEWDLLADKLTINAVMKELKEKGRYSVNFFVKSPEGRKRKKVDYYFTDEKQETLIASLRDFTDQDLLEKFKYTSEHDLVTGLYNRKKTFAQCRRLLEENPNQDFYICHMDIQRFHLINSFYGEETGNRLLMNIGNLLKKLSADFSCAVYGRIEADIFCFCVPVDKELLEKDVRLAKKWLQEYRTDFMLEANFGAYVIKNREMSIESMFARATLAAKHSKNALIHHSAYYNDEMERNLQVEQQISNDMRTALAQEQFEVYLQPKYILKSSVPCGAEALVRWKHPTKGMISPGDFIPLFEKNGFIIQLDHYMWEHVCKLLRGWLDQGQNPAPISVNVSRVSMYSPNTVNFLENLIEKYQLPHRLLQLELTESAYMDDPEEMKIRLKELQDNGFIILMDDFGSGYSSLNTLRELPVDYLKIDMRFLAKTQDIKRSRLILSSVIQMAVSLNLPVITEGVETIEQKEFLDNIGCIYAQGFLFARPMPVSDYEHNILFS